MEFDGTASMLAWYIAIELQRLRSESGHTMAQVAERLGCSTSHINHIEKGRDLPKQPEIEVLLEFYGLGERIPSFLELLKAARRGDDWFTGFAGASPEWFDLFLGLEAAAEQLESWDPGVIPGRFQIPEYTEHVIRRLRPDLTDAEVQRRIALRQARQELLTRPNAPTVWAIIDESVLHRGIPAPAMRRQLLHLDQIAEQPKVQLRVWKMSSGPAPGLHGPFVMMSLPHLPGLPAVVYTDGPIRGTYHKEPGEVLVYRNILTQLHADAAHPEESRAIIRRRAEELA
ncbi:helix-turn-helix transcriptional regulator [Amycolatopsis sp. NPDC059657]|uniref:helix-turn-helix domain-containing protein n=1 Tax=Amycolatopsis sp. NPDC059657 TaxID=3346899 RepID=UPI00366A889C